MGPGPLLLGAMLLLAPLGAARADDAPDVTILSAYRSLAGANERPRLRPHRGRDIAVPVGRPVLAAADGTVSLLIDYDQGCGNGVVLAHPAFRRWTVYCHLTRAVVVTGQVVARGQAIGFSGTSGNSANVPPRPPGAVHGALPLASRRDLRGTQDPIPLVVGCFED